jgi:hypothetical protein
VGYNHFVDQNFEQPDRGGAQRRRKPNQHETGQPPTAKWAGLRPKPGKDLAYAKLGGGRDEVVRLLGGCGRDGARVGGVRRRVLFGDCVRPRWPRASVMASPRSGNHGAHHSVVSTTLVTGSRKYLSRSPREFHHGPRDSSRVNVGFYKSVVSAPG